VGCHQSVSPEARSRIFALAHELDAPDPAPVPGPSAGPGTPSDGSDASAGSGFDRIRGAAKALGRRLFSKRRTP
jgi:hypothetical protein